MIKYRNLIKLAIMAELNHYNDVKILPQYREWRARTLESEPLKLLSMSLLLSQPLNTFPGK